MEDARSMDGPPPEPGTEAPSSERSSRSELPARKLTSERIWEEAVRQIQSGRVSKSVALSNNPPAQQIRRVSESEKEDHTLGKGTTRAKRLQRCVNLWTMQAFCMLLALTHCSAYYLNFEQTESLSGRIPIIWGSLFPLIFINIFELLVRVSAQGGPLLRLSSWLAFFYLVFHQFEAIFIVFLTYRFCRSTYLFLLFIDKNEMHLAGFNFTTDRITVPIVFAYRLFRAYGIFFNINLESTREHRQKRKQQQVWSVDYEKHLRAHRAKIFVRLQEVVNTRLFQIVIILFVLFHCGLYSFSRNDGFLAGYFYISKFTGYSMCAVFLFEFVVRAAAQGGFEAFFFPVFHRIEAVFAVSGVLLTGYSSYYHFAIEESRAVMEPSGVLTAGALIIHRLIRCVGLYMGISASEVDHFSVLEAEGSKLFRHKFADLLKMPAENLKVSLQPGKLTISVHKAELNASTFEGLHLPISVRGGIVEDLYVMIKTDSATEMSVPRRVNRLLPAKSRPMTIVSVKNMLVLLGPTDSLAEAGGVQHMGTYWNHDTVRAAKAKLVELIHRHLSAPSEQDTPGRPTHQSMGSTQGRQSSMRESFGMNFRYMARRFLEQTKEKAANVIKQKCLRHVEVDLRRVTLQFDDNDGLLGFGPMSMGVRLGEATVDAEHGKYVQCRLLRMGVFVEHGHHGKVGSSSEPLHTLLRKHPESAKKELERLDRIGIFRTWALEELERLQPVSDRLRHKRMEALKDGREVFSISKLCFCAGPMRGELHRQGQEDLETLLAASLKDIVVALGPGSDPEVVEDATWKWTMDATPVRISLDEMQARCVKTVVACVQAWMIHDNAFKWWPYLRLTDVNTKEITAHERSSIVRLWWIYAIHRVLAMKRMRPKVLWMDVMWRARNYQRYKGLVTRIAWRQGTQAQQPLVDFARGWERVHMEELQMQLPLADIIDCRKKALNIMHTKFLPSRHRNFGRSLSDLRSAGFSTFSFISMPSQSSDTPPPPPPKMCFPRKSEESKGEFSDQPLSNADSCPPVRRSSLSSQVNAPVIFKGIWELCVPVVEVRILRCSLGASFDSSAGLRRPLLVLASAAGLFVDALVEQPSEGNAVCSATFTVDRMRLRSPEADPLLMGGTRHLCTVLEHLMLPPPTGGLLPGRRVGEEVAFAARGQWNSTGSGVCEVHVPDLRVIMYEPLLLVLMTYARLDPPPPMSFLELDESSRRYGASKLGNHSQFLTYQNSQQLVVHSSRQGPMQSTFEINESDLSSMTACRLELHEHASHVREVRKFMDRAHSNQNRFELLVGMVGLTVDMEVRLNVGAIHCTQVGEYSRTHLLIEQCRFWPFISHAFRGSKDEFTPADDSQEDGFAFDEFPLKGSAGPPKKFELSFNGFSEATLMDWDDTRWKVGRRSTKCVSSLVKKEPVELENPAPPRSMKDWMNFSTMLGHCTKGYCWQSDNKVQRLEVKKALSSLQESSPESPAVSREDSGLSLLSEKRPSATCEVEVSMVPCSQFTGDWLVRESRAWHASVREEVPRPVPSESCGSITGLSSFRGLVLPPSL